MCYLQHMEFRDQVEEARNLLFCAIIYFLRRLIITKLLHPSKQEILNQCRFSVGLRRWPNIKPALVQCLVFARIVLFTKTILHKALRTVTARGMVLLEAHYYDEGLHVNERTSIRLVSAVIPYYRTNPFFK